MFTLSIGRSVPSLLQGTQRVLYQCSSTLDVLISSPKVCNFSPCLKFHTSRIDRRAQNKKPPHPIIRDPTEACKRDDSVVDEHDKGFSTLPDNLYKTIELELLAYEPSILDSYEWFILTSASHLGITVENVWSPRKSDKWRFSLLKSAFVHKKHKVHYEVRTYHRFITLKRLTGSTASTYLEYIQRNIPEGVGMKVSKLEVLPQPEFITDQVSSKLEQPTNQS